MELCPRARLQHPVVPRQVEPAQAAARGDGGRGGGGPFDHVVHRGRLPAQGCVESARSATAPSGYTTEMQTHDGDSSGPHAPMGDDAPTGSVADRSQVEVEHHLQQDGFGGQFGARKVPGCSASPATGSSTRRRSTADRARRVEGESDPSDMAILVPATCPHCGTAGTLVLQFGPMASAEESDVLAALPGCRPRSIRPVDPGAVPTSHGSGGGAVYEHRARHVGAQMHTSIRSNRSTAAETRRSTDPTERLASACCQHQVVTTCRDTSAVARPRPLDAPVTTTTRGSAGALLARRIMNPHLRDPSAARRSGGSPPPPH